MRRGPSVGYMQSDPKPDTVINYLISKEAHEREENVRVAIDDVHNLLEEVNEELREFGVMLTFHERHNGGFHSQQVAEGIGFLRRTGHVFDEYATGRPERYDFLLDKLESDVVEGLDQIYSQESYRSAVEEAL